MNKNKLINKGDFESLGKAFLSEAVDFAMSRSFGKSYEFFKQGLDFLTCDCEIGDWLVNYKKSDEKIFDEKNINQTENTEFYFVKAYILSFEHDYKNLQTASNSIDNYLIERKDDYGYYVKGKILLSLNNYTESLKNFTKALSYSNNSRLNYRIGRIKEQHLNQDGLKELFESFLSNYSSACCCRNLKKYMIKKGKKLDFDEDESNDLLKEFNSSNSEWRFQEMFEKTMEYQNYKLYKDGDLYSLQRVKAEISAKKELANFVSVIHKNYDIFIYEEYGNNYNEYYIEQDNFFKKQYEEQEEYENDDNYNVMPYHNSIYDNPYYNETLDMDQQDLEFWDNL